MQITLDQTSREPLYQQLANHILQRIRNGALPPGTRLPTVRQFAHQLGVTRLTVHSAYAELQADGWVEATVGRGTFVAERVETMMESPQAMLGREVTPSGIMADMMHAAQMRGVVSLARADPAMELFPLRQWQQATELALTNGGPALMNYITAQGDQVLRSAVAEFVRERGITASPDEMLITSGATQGLSLVTEVLACSGATVLVEQPTFLGMLGTLAAHGVRAVGVPLDNEGVNIAALTQIIQTERPAFLYTISAYHNPTGVSLSPERRMALLDLAARHNLMILEDDVYGLVSYASTPPPTLKSEDRHGLVVYLSSFSKNLMPGLRMGYVVAAPNLIQRLVQMRQAQDLCASPLMQRALAIFIEQGWLHAHIKRVTPRYRERRDALLQAMERFFPHSVTWTNPQGGFSCWVGLPPDMSVKELYLSAIGRGVAFAPGEVFSPTPDPVPHFRLCYGCETPEHITEAVATLGSLLREQSAHPLVSGLTSRDYVPLV